ncbi:MAG: hypothetical protein ACI4IK_01580 [Eubacterium sp.]
MKSNLEILKEKLLNVSDTYAEFVESTIILCNKHKSKHNKVVEKMIEYIDNHKTSSASEISEYLMYCIGVPYCDDNGVWYRWDKVITETEAYYISQEEYCDD